MKFGQVPVAEAEGAILAHSLAINGGRIRKGCVLSGADIAALIAADHEIITVARLETGDVGEDAAAATVAKALVPDPAAVGLRVSKAHTGRVNIYADIAGVISLDTAKVSGFNAVDPMITLATVLPYARVAEGQMVGTVKIISYGVAENSVRAVAGRAAGAMKMLPVIFSSASLIITQLKDGEDERAQRAIVDRLRSLNMSCDVKYVRHDELAIADAVSHATGDIVLILTASATSDEMDVAPQAVRHAGGNITRFGIPVDPGNLLFLGAIGKRPVIGLPGCARSPALNGADWVLERVVCGVSISDSDLAAMGVGGLLKESPARGMPREQKKL